MKRSRNFVRTYISGAILAIASLVSLPAAAQKFTPGFFERVEGPSTKPISKAAERGDAFFQDCVIRINGFVVGSNTGASTDADGTHNLAGGYLTYVHDAGKLGKFTLTFPKVNGPFLRNDVLLDASTAAAFPEVANLVGQGYFIRTVSADIYDSTPSVTQWEGTGIFKNVTKITVRCVFLITPNWDLVRCIDCLYYFS